MAYTPMIEQYFKIKDDHPGDILMYRLGDFYEMFFEDAQIASKVLDITLTSRDCGEGHKALMCGVPYHAVDAYIGKLISKGYRVAVCEQVEDPATAKGIVKREVTRIITPGTVIEAELLNERRYNYLASVYMADGACGICFVDISTADIHATEVKGDIERKLLSDFATYTPKEVVSNVEMSDVPQIHDFLKKKADTRCFEVRPDLFKADEAFAKSQKYFGEKANNPEYRNALIAAGAVLSYIEETQKTDVSYLSKIDLYENAQFLEMDLSTRRNLELCETMLAKEKKGSLLWVLDKTSSAPGARLLKNIIEHPLTSVNKIRMRQEAVGEIASNFVMREELRESLAKVLDLERLITKVTYETADAKDLRSIYQTLEAMPKLKSTLETATSQELKRILGNIDTVGESKTLIEISLVENPPALVKDGGIIRDGYNFYVDELRRILNNADEWIKSLEVEEREKTGIKNLRIGNNRIHGYYIEVPRSQRDKVPESYVRKQTLMGMERYVTKELKETETTILGASDKLKAMEYHVFSSVRKAVGKHWVAIRKTAIALAELDVLVSLAECAVQNGYVCPEVDLSSEIHIKEGRHPVVERTSSESYFVPNDTFLNSESERFMLITGPNMAGKSTYMRQTALIVIMAQIGSFVPAASARIGIVDKLFTRVGASDDLANGTSTFMLEMKEVSNIVTSATRDSLIIYDEIGRGTSTFDGMSIARAVAEYTCRKIGARTMFATHYHELVELEGEVKGIVNYNVAVKRRGDELTFLRKIVKGPVDESYGIQVAKLAGVPEPIVERAKKILAGLENGQSNKKAGNGSDGNSESEPSENAKKSGIVKGKPIIKEENRSLFDMEKNFICAEIKLVDPNIITPIEAMNMICRWKDSLKDL